MFCSEAERRDGRLAAGDQVMGNLDRKEPPPMPGMGFIASAILLVIAVFVGVMLWRIVGPLFR